jgi:hypothetical protein
MQVMLQFLATYWLVLAIAALAGVVYVAVQLWLNHKYGPKDITGNGITIGTPKAFDNRSLALRIERLSASLDQLKIVNQNVTENLSKIQTHTTTQSEHSVALEVKATSAVPKEEDPTKKSNNSDTKSEPATAGAKTASPPDVTLAASDILSDQLNLASQILNLETLYERSLTDRIINGKSRLQTVLGFQVSITPPAGSEDCVAIVEVSVRLKKSMVPVSLVALIPQEKTYNAQTVSSSATSIGGSAVARVLTLGFSSKGESRQLFVHRDSDTIAFERNPRSKPPLFDCDCTPTVFGWEFRPVLGRKTVSAGTRQMLAVIAIPAEDNPPDGQHTDITTLDNGIADTRRTADDVPLEIRTRSYWRRYNSKKQTSRKRWRGWPQGIDGSRRVDTPSHELTVPDTARIQDALEQIVKQIRWVNSGTGRATVMVNGSNFFSGTKVVIGGEEYSEGHGLVLKSNQTLEFETSLQSIATGDSVLSGRFGRSSQLLVPKEGRPVDSLFLQEMKIEPGPFGKKAFLVSAVVLGYNDKGAIVGLDILSLQKLPEPLLFVGNDPVPLPYDYNEETVTFASVVRTAVRVAAWISSEKLTRSASLAFKVPFCGANYQASLPLNFLEPNVTRIGGDNTKSVFRIASSLGFLPKPVTIDLDKEYSEDDVVLTRVSDNDLRFVVPSRIVSQYTNIVVRSGGPEKEPYVLQLPAEEQPAPRTSINSADKPTPIKKGSLGPYEWSGTGLYSINSVRLHSKAKPPDPPQKLKPPAETQTPAEFTVYDGGKRIAVYFQTGSTEVLGIAEVEFLTTTNESIRVPLFIVQEAD